MTRNKIAISILVLSTAGALGDAQAAEVDVAQRLARVLSSAGQDYLAAREALLEQGALAFAALAARRDRSTYSEATWQEDVVVEALLLRANAPAEARRAQAIEGLDPRVYLARRRPEPEVGRELARLALSPASLFELELKIREAYPFARRDAYPAHLDDARVSDLRKKEALALRLGVISALAASRHPARAHLLRARLADPQEDLRVRRVAALELPRAGADEALPVLTSVARDPGAPLALRIGAVSGLGRVRLPAALEVLTSLARSRDAAELRRPALAAIGALANPWTRAEAPGADLERLGDEASRALVEVLAGPDGGALEASVLEACTMIASPLLRERLARLAAADAPDGEVRARAERALRRVERALPRAG